MLLDVDTTLPLTISGTFRPRLRLMWPAGLMTQSVGWDPGASASVLTEESTRFAAVIGAPGARDVSLMPYQEEPRDVPIRFVIDTAGRAGREFLPIVITGSVRGRDEAMARYRALLGSISAQYDLAVDHYARLARETVQIITPDRRLNAAYAWARVGIDKGLATNPMLGTGVRAGMTGREADALAREVLEAGGLGPAFSHSLGHGLGLEVHEEPRLARTAEGPLPAGAVVTVEPGVYFEGWGGVRLEDDVHLAADGPELLSPGAPELLELL